jgi:hypothetical protein
VPRRDPVVVLHDAQLYAARSGVDHQDSHRRA